MIGTGEHGVGEGKRKYLVGELGQGTVDFLKTIKQTLDPLNLFNPGKVSSISQFQQSIKQLSFLCSSTPTRGFLAIFIILNVCAY